MGQHVSDQQSPLVAEEVAADDPFVWVAKMRSVFADPKYQPPVLPKIAVEIQQLTMQPAVDFRHILATLERDPIFAGQVLARAQSPIYAARVPARSLEDVVLRLGLRNIRNIVWEIALKLRVFTAPGYEEPLASLARHCSVTAHIAQAVAARVSSVDGGTAFIAGLLHDAGLGACLIVMGEQAEPVPLAPLAMGLDLLHCEASDHLAGIWELEDDVRLALRCHHRPSTSNQPLASVVCLAQHLANHTGAAIDLVGPDCDAEEEAEVDYATRTLQLTETQLDLLRSEAEKIVFFTR